MALPHLQQLSRPSSTRDYGYYVRVANDTAKQRQWNSARCMERSAEAYRESYMPDTRLEKLAERRKRLAHVLHNESLIYQAELRNTKFHSTPGIIGDMTDRVAYLREQKELQRKKVVEEKMKQHMRLNAPELRQVNSRMLKQDVHKGWETQRQHHKEEEDKLKKEKLEDIMASERATIRYQLERQKEEEDRKMEAIQQADTLRSQMEKLRLREQESTILRAQEEDLLLQQDEIARAEKLRRDMEHRKERIQFGRLLKAQALAALRRRSRQIQDELELDLQILAKLADKEVAVENIATSRREKAKADAKWMKQVVEEQLQLERAREAELDTLYREEAARQWEKRETQWKREAEARERLMREVLDGRAEQLLRRQEEVREEQEQTIRAREELLENLELLAQETSRQTERSAREKVERRREIDKQARDEGLAAAEERAAEEESRLEERRAADDYADMIRHEAESMTQRGFISRGRRGAWM